MSLSTSVNQKKWACILGKPHMPPFVWPQIQLPFQRHWSSLRICLATWRFMSRHRHKTAIALICRCRASRVTFLWQQLLNEREGGCVANVMMWYFCCIVKNKLAISVFLLVDRCQKVKVQLACNQEASISVFPDVDTSLGWIMLDLSSPVPRYK